MSDSTHRHPADDGIIYWHQNVILRRFMVVSCLVLCWIGCDLGLLAISGNTSELLKQFRRIDFEQFHLYTAYSLPLSGLLTFGLLCGFVRQGNTELPRTITVCGSLFIIGGALTDITVTVIHSPDLAMEGNPYLRVLLDSNHSLVFVYGYACITQSLYIALFCGLWLGFLKHRRTIADSVSAAAPRTVFDFVKAATGGSHLTTRQWLLPLHPSEIPLLYHYVWLVAIPIVFGISLFRWYVAMEWLGVVEPDFVTRVGVGLHGICGGLIVYLFAVWRLCLSNRICSTEIKPV